jgi:LysB family phage lysis regulatory protein
MIGLRILLPLALVAGLSLYIWGLEARRDMAVATAQRAIEQRDQFISHANDLAKRLSDERTAQAKLRTAQNDLRRALTTRQQQIEALTRENQELRDWADQLLPAAARGLRQRPDLTGAAAYRQWLSGRGAMPAASDPSGP